MNDFLNRLVSLDDSIDQLQLGARAKNGLANLKINTIRDLVKLSENELLRAKNLGRISVLEIKDKLNEYGLSLRMLLPPNLPSNTTSPSIFTVEKPCLQTIKLYYLFKPIKETALPVRAKNCFKDIGIKFIHEVLAKETCYISTLNNMGNGTFERIEEEFAKHGLNLNTKIDIHSEEVKSALIEQFQNHSAKLMPGNIESFLEKDVIADILEREFAHHISIDPSYYSAIYFDAILSDLINSSLPDFSEREQQVIFSRLLDITPKTLEELGTQLNLTRERVRQIQIKASQKFEQKFSTARTFLNRCIIQMEKNELDPFKALNLSKCLFTQRDTLTQFLKEIGIDQNLSDQINEHDSSIEKKIVRDLLLSHQMPLDKEQIISFAQESYCLSPVQAKNLFEKLHGSAFLNYHDRFIVNAPTNVLAIANVSLMSPNGMQWDMLAQIAKNMFRKCSNIRTEGSADSSISLNSHIYLSDRGTYKNTKFYSLTAEEESKLIDIFTNYVRDMREDVKHLPQIIDELKIKHNVYDVLHLLKDRSEMFNFETTSGRMLLKKHEDAITRGFDVQALVYAFLKEKSTPLTSFDIKECLTSKSENHAKFALSQLIESGKVILIDEMRYATIEHYDPKMIDMIMFKINSLIKNSNQVLAGSYLKIEVEKENKTLGHHRYFYSSLARIVCNNEGYKWVRHCCSRDNIDENFSLRSFATSLYEQGCKDFDYFSLEFNRKILSDEVTVRRYFDVAKRTSKMAA